MNNTNTKGHFITVEGSEGAGKSTNMTYIRALLEGRDISVVQTREPGGTELGEEIRSLLLGHKHDGMCDDTELLLVFAARNEHLNTLIKPALAEGKWVLCDRFTDATYAYQGGGRGISQGRISQLENWVQQGLEPDLTIFLDIHVSEGLKRTQNRDEGPDRFERQKIDFFERVRDCYLDRASAQERFRVIDASLTLSQVQEQIRAVVDSYVKQNQ